MTLGRVTDWQADDIVKLIEEWEAAE